MWTSQRSQGEQKTRILILPETEAAFLQREQGQVFTQKRIQLFPFSEECFVPSSNWILWPLARRKKLVF